MSDDAKVTMVLYRDLSPVEQAKLEVLDIAVARFVLDKLGRTDRPIWTSATDNGKRLVRLCLADPHSTVVMEIAADELGLISTDALLSKLVATSPPKPDRPRVGGLLEYFGLESWWHAALTESERRYINQKYQPLGASGSSLTSGAISATNESPVAFLHTLAGWFSGEAERPIAHKILQKADEFRGGARVLDLHFLCGAKVDIYYKDRNSPALVERAIQACKEQIELAPRAAAAFKAQYAGEPLPSHKGYEQLAIILEKNKKFEEAIALCAKAQEQGWAGDWDKRIERCRKRVSKAQKYPGISSQSRKT